MQIKEILKWLSDNHYHYSFRGNEDDEVLGFASLQTCTPGKMTWVKKQENYDQLEKHSDVMFAVVQEGLDLDIPNQILSDNSKNVFFAILRRFWGKEHQKGFIGSGTYISPEAKVSPTAYIGCNCSFVGNITIGDNTVIENNVSIINDVSIGRDGIIHSGVVIGGDGFGFAFDDKGMPIKVEHFGGVSIGDRVEIGANTCIDRGTIDNTCLEDDVKIDNLVHIAHNAIIRKGSLVVAGAVICGSAELGEESYVAPGGIVKNQLKIGGHSLVGLGAVVTKPVDEYSVVAGVPAKEIRKVRPGDK